MASGFWQAENLSKLGAGLIGPRSHSQSSLSLSLSLSSATGLIAMVFHVLVYKSSLISLPQMAV